MNRQPLWQLSLRIVAEAEELVSEIAAQVFKHPVASYTDADTGRITLTVYSHLRDEFSNKRLADFRVRLGALAAAGANLGAGRLRVQRLAPQDWAESWKRHFRPLEIGKELLVKPSWSKRRPRAGQTLVVLDPGLSFGTGQHPTTAFCLEQIVACRAAANRPSILDLGTGSGILAIAAAKLGYAPVRALDFDAEAVRVARSNARQNRVTARIRFARMDVAKLPRRSAERFDLVCANLISTLLLTERERIVNRVAAGGTLVIAGILRREFAEVQRAYESCGVRLVSARTVREWRSGAFRRSLAGLKAESQVARP